MKGWIKAAAGILGGLYLISKLNEAKSEESRSEEAFNGDVWSKVKSIKQVKEGDDIVVYID